MTPSSPPPGASLHYQTSERADALEGPFVLDRAIAIPTPCDNAKTRGGRSISMSSASPLFPSVDTSARLGGSSLTWPGLS